MKNKKSIEENITDYINKSNFLDAELDDGIIHVESGLATIYVEEDTIVVLAFNLEALTEYVAHITKLVVESIAKYEKFEVQIAEPYLMIYDENDGYVDTLYGNEARRYQYDKIMDLATSQVKIKLN